MLLGKSSVLDFYQSFGNSFRTTAISSGASVTILTWLP